MKQFNNETMISRNDCLFCAIANNEKPSHKRYEDGLVIAFDDINPKAKYHVLIVPRKHIESVATMEEGDDKIAGHMIHIAKTIAQNLGIADDGYRLVINTRSHGGQIIDHIHLHLLGGQRLGPMA